MYALKEEQAWFAIQVGYIFTLLTFVVIVSFTVFITVRPTGCRLSEDSFDQPQY